MSKSYRKPIWRHPHERDVSINHELVGNSRTEVVNKETRRTMNRAERRGLRRRGVNKTIEWLE